MAVMRDFKRRTPHWSRPIQARVAPERRASKCTSTHARHIDVAHIAFLTKKLVHGCKGAVRVFTGMRTTGAAVARHWAAATRHGTAMLMMMMRAVPVGIGTMQRKAAAGMRRACGEGKKARQRVRLAKLFHTSLVLVRDSLLARPKVTRGIARQRPIAARRAQFVVGCVE